MIQLGGRSCIIFTLSLVYREIGKANKNVSDGNLQQSRVGKHLCDVFHVMNDLKQGDSLSPLFSTLLLSTPLRGFR